MALKFKFKSKDEIPAEHLPLYAEREGAWMLDVDGAVEKAKLDEFRTTNVALIKERDELKQRFEGINPDEVKALAEEKRRLEEQQQLKAGEVEKVFENRLKSLKAELEKQTAGLTAERDALTARLTAIQIDQGVTGAATKRGLRPTAIPDITARARAVFRLVNGAPTAFEADGKTVRYGKDGLTPMTLEEWVDGQVSDAPHLFESNAGGGAASNASGGAGALRIPHYTTPTLLPFRAGTLLKMFGPSRVINCYVSELGSYSAMSTASQCGVRLTGNKRLGEAWLPPKGLWAFPGGKWS